MRTLSLGGLEVDPDSVNSREILDETFAGYRVLWRYLGALSLAVTLGVVLFTVLLVVAMGMIGVYAAVVLSVVATFWVVGMLVQTIDDLHEDDEPETSLRARFARFWPHVNRVSAAALLLSLLFAPGWLLMASGHAGIGALLVLVGVVVSPWFVLAVPLVVIEGYGVGDAFVESRQAVAGNALKVFWVLFVLGFLTGLVANLAERLAIAITDSWELALLVSGVFDAVVTTPLMALALIGIYQALRQPVASPAGAPATA